MARINLLPWREAERKRRLREFGFLLAGGFLLALGASFYMHLHVESMIDNQNHRNNFLKSEIAQVDRKIKEIRNLEKTKANLIARMNIIQQLQASRPEIVHLFDELVGTLPEGVYLTEMQQRGRNIDLKGRAQSNARVSSYMRNIDASEWLHGATLKVIENKDQTGTGFSHFHMTAKQINKAKAREQSAQKANRENNGNKKAAKERGK
jgi:type IV pilus assembly protein PilN